MFQPDAMNRRSALRTPALAAAGAATLFATASREAHAADASATRQGPHVLARDGTRLLLRDWGTGPAMLFLAGWALPSDFWSSQMLALSDAGVRCLAYDRRGHGGSDDPGRGYDYDTLADDLADVVEAVNPPQPLVLVAHSMAGGEVVRYLRRHGRQRVAGVVLIGTTLPTVARSSANPQGVLPAQFEAYRQATLFADYPKWLQDNARPFFTPTTSVETLEWVKSTMLRTSMKAAMDCHRAQTGTDFSDELSALDLPLLLVHGDKDTSAPLPITSRVVAQRTGGRLEIYEGAPHGLPITHAKRLNADLMKFLQERKGAAS